MPSPISVQFSLAYTFARDVSNTDILAKDTFTVPDSTTNLYEASGFRAVVPGGNVQLNLNGVTATRLILLVGDAAFVARFGAADADPIYVAPMAAAQRAVFLGTVPDVSSIWIENESTSVTLGIKWAVAGT